MVLLRQNPKSSSGRLPLPQAVPYLAGSFFPVQLPGRGERQLCRRRFAFGVYQRIDGQPAIGFQCGAGRDEQVLMKGRINEDDVEGGGRRAGKQRQGVLLADLGTVALQGLQVAAQGGYHLATQVTAQHMAGAAGQCFQGQRTAAGEQVQAAGALDVPAQPIEQGFAHPVRGRPQPRLFDETETAAAPFAGDDAQLAGSGLLLSHGLSSAGSSRVSAGSTAGCSGIARAGPTVMTRRCCGSKCRANACWISSVVSACT